MKAEIKVKGLKELQERIFLKFSTLEDMLDQAFLMIGEDAVTYSKLNKGYKDHTANLKNSISFALFKDGKLIRMVEGKIPKPDEAANGQSEVSGNLQKFLTKDGVVLPNGYSLAIVAGMNYGVYVERKGYNVLYLTRFFLADEMEKTIDDVIEIVKGL